MKKVVKTIIAICVVGTSLSAYADNNEIGLQIIGERMLVEESPDVFPEYPGGINGLMSFISSNIVYPPSAVDMDIKGKVVVRFVVDKEGNVSDPEVVSSVHPLLDAEAIRVVSLLKGFTPGEKNGEKVKTWYTLPINFRLQDTAPDSIEWDVAEIDSIGYSKMMDLGLAAQRENNLEHATACFKEAYHINPYSIDPLERIVKMNASHGKSDSDYDIYAYGVDQLSQWNRLNGTGNGAVFPMEWLAEQMQRINPQDIAPRMKLLVTYLEAPSESLRSRANGLLDNLIPLSEEQELWGEYGSMMTIKGLFLEEEDAIISLYEPNVAKLMKSPQGAVALMILSRVYSEVKGDSVKAAQYMRMAEEADPERVELPKRLE